jgi:hypothetical protein
MSRWDFPIARRLLGLARAGYANWRARHRVPFNFAIHLVGIPLACAGLLLLFWDWRWGLAAVVAGYLLQWVGHSVEGNDLGEWAAIKRMLGLPYVGVAPRWRTAEEVKNERRSSS